MDLVETCDLGVNDSGTVSKNDTQLTQPRSPDVHVRRLSDAWGYTYFVRRGDAIKIGHSAIPKQRINTLQVAFPEPLEVLAVIPNTIITEYAAHQKFAHLRMSGEWFRAAPDLIEFISKAKAEAKLAAKAHPPIRFVPKADPVITNLLRCRAKRGHNSAIGFRCSNLTELIPNYRKATDPELRAWLAAEIRRQTTELAGLMAA